MAEEAKDMGEMGDKPTIECLLVSLSDQFAWVHKPGYAVKVSLKTTSGEIKAKLLEHLGDYGSTVGDFMWEGKTLDLEQTPKNDGVVVPGPAARRAGEKLKINFSVDRTVVDDISNRAAEVPRRWEALVRKWDDGFERERQKLKAERRAYVEDIRKKAALFTWTDDKLGFARQTWPSGKYACMRRVQLQRSADTASEEVAWLAPDTKVDIEEVTTIGGDLRGRVAEPAGWITLRNQLTRFQYARFCGVVMDDAGPRHHLERLSEDQCHALEQLLSQTGGGGTKVLAAYHNDNPDKRFQYEEMKKRMVAGSETIKKSECKLSKIVMEQKEKYFPLLGEYEASVNEFPLWHGTPSSDAVKGICANGMDINFFRVGVFGTGFYFSDMASTSLGYCGAAQHINSHFPSVRCIFLCRVVVGTTKYQDSSGLDDESRQRLYAESKGPGGVFGPSSSFHTLFCQHYVCMSADQCYPEYIILVS